MTTSLSENLTKLIDLYLVQPNTRTDNKINEVEVRFGIAEKHNPRNTKPKFLTAKPITRRDYDNVISHLLSAGFECKNKEGDHLLRITTTFVHKETHQLRDSNTRAEIVGLHLIQQYCEKNDLSALINRNTRIQNTIKFTTKSSPTYPSGDRVEPINMDEYNYRISYKLEQDFSTNGTVSQTIITNWKDSKKKFRYMNRIRLSHPTLPINADISIIKTNTKSGNTPLPQYTIQEAKVFDNEESYEIELEIDNTRVGLATDFNTTEKVLNALRQCIRQVLIGLQQSNFPISFSEMDKVYIEYMNLMHNSTDIVTTNPNTNTNQQFEPRLPVTSDFVGPSSVTLLTSHLYKTSAINILQNYCVTDKADGERRLLFIHTNGRIYTIDTNMNIIWSGEVTKKTDLYGTLIDGEWVKFDKHGKFINQYLAFDIYFIKKTNCRGFPFTTTATTTENKIKIPLVIGGTIEKEETIVGGAGATVKYRLQLLKERIDVLSRELVMVHSNDKTNLSHCIFKIGMKDFQTNVSIFDACNVVLEKVQTYQYNTDGLILTPCSEKIPVGTNKTRNYKITWDLSFKWKPANYNTIDFLVRMKKNKHGQDEIHTLLDTDEQTQSIKQYKTIILCCGYDRIKHRLVNPSIAMMDLLVSPTIDKDKDQFQYDKNDTYRPVPFQPSNPFDPTAYLCNIMLQPDDLGQYVMKTQEEDGNGEYFEEDMIVEFAYVNDSAIAESWRWKPIRVRHDKTAELRSGQKNYGNSFLVANSNWTSIHNPITPEMIRTGQNIEKPQITDVYYNTDPTIKSTKQSMFYTRAMRDFHNLYVKRSLIMSVTHSGDTLIDFAVGKAGDLSKWKMAQTAFVLGIDISRDNINNIGDGACVRYVNDQVTSTTNFRALFLVGNSSKNIRTGDAMATPKEKEYIHGIFSSAGSKQLLGKYASIGHKGFSVGSCQFALHYMFENEHTFHGFLRNLSECICVGGYFIGTCFDGQLVFNSLRNYEKGKGIVISSDKKTIFELQKLYSETGFPSNSSCLGYKINVFQESINQYIEEYLVHFEYFTRIMENYGFILVKPESTDKHIPMPSGSGLFRDLYQTMSQENKKEYGMALQMTQDEKNISFLNRYFIFTKVRDVDAKNIYKFVENMATTDDNGVEVETKTEKENDYVEQISKKQKLVSRKIKLRKFVIDAYSPMSLEDEESKNDKLGVVVEPKIPVVESKIPVVESKIPVVESKNDKLVSVEEPKIINRNSNKTPEKTKKPRDPNKPKRITKKKNNVE